MRSLTDIIKHCFRNVRRYRHQLHDYQNIAIQFIKDNPYCALFLDCGLGKTGATLTAILDLLCEFKDVKKVLIVAPLRVANETWPTEIQEWSHTAALSYINIREDKITKAIDKRVKAVRAAAKALRPTTDEHEELLWANHIAKRLINKRIENSINNIADLERAQAAEEIVKKQFYDSKAAIHIINREQVEFLVEIWGRKWPYDTVIIDESSAFKDHTTKRFKALRKVRPLINRVIELTATPVAETYLHLFAQIFLLDQGARLGKDITTYKKRYFDFNSYTHTYTLREGAEEQITALISDITLVMKGEDYLDLEEPIFDIQHVILDPDQMTLYKTMETDFLVTLDNGTVIEAETGAAKSQKLQQMASGVIYESVPNINEFGEIKHTRIVHELHDHKIEKLFELVEASSTEPILVTYHLKSSLARLQKAFPKATTMDKDGKCVKAWNKGKIPMLFISPQSAAHGLNLQYGGRRMVFFDIPWSFEQYYQVFKRLARQGQELLVFIHFLVVEGTIDELIVEALTTKGMTQDRFFALLKKFQQKFKLS